LAAFLLEGIYYNIQCNYYYGYITVIFR